MGAVTTTAAGHAIAAGRFRWQVDFDPGPDTDELTSVQDFENVVNEYVTPQSTAKWA